MGVATDFIKSGSKKRRQPSRKEPTGAATSFILSAQDTSLIDLPQSGNLLYTPKKPTPSNIIIPESAAPLTSVPSVSSVVQSLPENQFDINKLNREIELNRYTKRVRAYTKRVLAGVEPPPQEPELKALIEIGKKSLTKTDKFAIDYARLLEIPGTFPGMSNLVLGPATIAGVTGIEVPGYNLYKEKHPISTSLQELPGTFVPFSLAIKLLSKAGLVSKGGRLHRAGIRGMRDALALAGVEGTSTLIGGKGLSEAVSHALHAAPLGASFGFTGEMVRPLHAALRIATQGAAGSATMAAVNQSIDPQTLIMGAALPMLFESFGAIPDISFKTQRIISRIKAKKTAKKESPLSGARPTKEYITVESGQSVDPSVTSVVKRIELPPDQRPGLIRRMKQIGIEPADAEAVARGDLPLDKAVRRSIPDNLKGADYVNEYEARIAQAKGPLVIRQLKLQEDLPWEEELIEFNAGVPLKRLINIKDIDPNLNEGYERMIKTLREAQVRSDGAAMTESINKFLPNFLSEKTKNAAALAGFYRRGMWENTLYYLGRKKEALSIELPSALAEIINNDLRRTLTTIELGDRFMSSRIRQVYGDQWGAPLEDQIKFGRLLRGIHNIDNDGNVTFATRAPADALFVKSADIPGFGKIEYIDALPNGKGGAPVRYYIANRKYVDPESAQSAKSVDQEITRSQLANSLDDEIINLADTQILRVGDSFVHNGETVYLGDRAKRVPAIRPAKTIIELTEIDAPRVTRVDKLGKKRNVLARPRKKAFISAYTERETGHEAIKTLLDPKTKQINIENLIPQKSRLQLEGVDYVYDGIVKSAKGAQKIRLIHPESGKPITLPIESVKSAQSVGAKHLSPSMKNVSPSEPSVSSVAKKSVTIAPTRGVRSDHIFIKDLKSGGLLRKKAQRTGTQLFHNGVKYQVTNIRNTGDFKAFDPENPVHKAVTGPLPSESVQSAKSADIVKFAWKEGLRPDMIENNAARAQFENNLDQHITDWRKITLQEAAVAEPFEPQIRVHRDVDVGKTKRLLTEMSKKYPGTVVLVKKLRAEREQLWTGIFNSTMSPISFNVARSYYDIQSNLIPEVAYVPSVSKDKVSSLGRGFGAAIGFKPRVAGGRLFKSGKQATEGKEIEHVGVAHLYRQQEFFAESVLRDFDTRMLAISATPIGPEGTLTGFTPLFELYGGNRSQLVRTLRQQPELLKLWNITEPDLARATNIAGEQFQVPNAIAEMLHRRGSKTKVLPETSSKAFNAAAEASMACVRAVNSYYTANLLTRPSTAVRNWFSGEILYAMKTMEDGFDGGLDILFEKIFPGYKSHPLKFLQLKNDLVAVAASLSKESMATMPAELFGGRFYDTLIRETALPPEIIRPETVVGKALGTSKGIVDLNLRFFEAVEIGLKRRSWYADVKTDAEKIAFEFQQAPEFKGWQAYPGGKRAFVRRLMTNPLPQMFDRARTSIAETSGFDYLDNSKFIDWLAALGGRGVVPFPKWGYHINRNLFVQPIEDAVAIAGAIKKGVTPKDAAKYLQKQELKRIAERAADPNHAQAWKKRDELFDPDNYNLAAAQNAAQLRKKTARLLAAASMWSIAWNALKLWDTGTDYAGGKLKDWTTQTFGRIRVPEGIPIIGSKGDTESWVRVFDVPVIGEAMYVAEILKGNSSTLDYFQDRMSMGALWNFINHMVGLTDEFNMYKSTGAKLGGWAETWFPLPGHRALTVKLADPIKRDFEGPYATDPEAFTSVFAGKMIPKVSKFFPPRINPHTGEIAEVSERLEALKFFVLHFKDVSKRERTAEEHEAITRALSKIDKQFHSVHPFYHSRLKRQKTRLLQELDQVNSER